MKPEQIVLDKLWSRTIRLGFVQCLLQNSDPIKFGGCSGGCQAHHVIRRGETPTRHEVNNGLKLCTIHHMMAELYQDRFEAAMKSLGLEKPTLYWTHGPAVTGPLGEIAKRVEAGWRLEYKA